MGNLAWASGPGSATLHLLLIIVSSNAPAQTMSDLSMQLCLQGLSHFHQKMTMNARALCELLFRLDWLEMDS
jgi:hypothetical protein